MNMRSYLISSIVLFVYLYLAGFLFHGIIMSETYDLSKELMRPDEEAMSKMIWMILGFLILAFGFTYIFIAGYKGKGIIEGVRYGLIIAITFSISSSLINYTVFPYPDSWIYSWIVAYPIIMILAGVIVASLYKPTNS